ncbi:MAG TPA: hypothetical protein VLM38_18030 [Blastocatellia bacterium]|nr:hypothetical protein [Blastocatellia bacterium]
MKRSKTLLVLLGKRTKSGARLLLVFAATALLLSWSLPVRVQAADGDLDSGFADGGKLSADNGRGEAIQALALQLDGKIIGVGYMETKKKAEDFAVGRLLSDGTPDNSFGSEALTGVDFFGGTDVAYSVVIQPDGKIVVAGEAAVPEHSSSDFALARFNSDGSLDRSFGSDGTVITDFFGKAEHVFGLALQTDGKIVAVGFTQGTDQGPINSDFALARYNPDGSLDASFGTAGKVHTDFNSGSSDIAYATVIQSDGKIIAAGPVAGNFGLARYNPDGSLDPSFGYSQNGKVSIDFNGHEDLAYAMALQSDGKIVVAGYAFNQANTNRDFALARFDGNGTLDASFGVGGRVTNDFNQGPDVVCGVAIQPDDKIVATGSAWGFAGRDFGLARYNTDGSLDPSFGAAGKVQTDFFGRDDWAWGMALTSNGRIVTAGYAIGSENADFAVACYKAFSVVPQITGAEVSGKKLYVYGKYFDMGAELLLDGEPQGKTRNDGVTPFTMLIAKKSGKKIARGESVTIQVRNLDGRLSDGFKYTRPVE